MLIVAALVARLSPVPPAFLALLCSVLLTIAAVASDLSVSRTTEPVSAVTA